MSLVKSLLINGDINAQTKTRAHPGSELPSSRLALLACYAVAGRFATVLALYADLVAFAGAQAARAPFLFCLLPRAYALG